MKAIQYRAYGGYQENRLVDLERTRLKEGEVLFEMRTVGINPLDNTFRSGHIYAPRHLDVVSVNPPRITNYLAMVTGYVVTGMKGLNGPALTGNSRQTRPGNAFESSVNVIGVREAQYSSPYAHQKDE